MNIVRQMQQFNAIEQFILMSVPISAAIVSLAVVWNFISYNGKERQQTVRKSFVDTFSMYIFVFICYVVIVKKIGVFSIPIELRTLGSVIVYISMGINLYGRWVLKSNWSNEIRIRESHCLVNHGPFRWVRHPLYTSTITMIYGAALCYNNVLVILLNSVIFIPMMIYRAHQEEKELLKYVSGYVEYHSQVPMLFPFINWRK